MLDLGKEVGQVDAFLAHQEVVRKRRGFVFGAFLAAGAREGVRGAGAARGAGGSIAATGCTGLPQSEQNFAVTAFS